MIKRACLVWGAVGALVAGCGVRGPVATTAFRAADAIVVVNRATPKTKTGGYWYRDALVDLTNVMARVTGTVPAVYEEGSEPKDAKAVVYLGETEAAKAAGLGDAKLRRGDWRVKTVPGKAYLYGVSGMGASRAMSEFAESCLDYGFYTPDDYWPFAADPAKEVPLVDIVRKPVIYYRDVYTETPAWTAWTRRNYGGYQDEMEGSTRLTGLYRQNHTQFTILPPEKYFKDHPEWYSMGEDGKRHGVPNHFSELCYSNPRMRDEFYANLVKYIEQDRAKNPTSYPAIYDMTQLDNCNYLCLCPECKKVIAKYNRVPGGHAEGGDAGLQLEFANDIARRVAKRYPDAKLRIFAYVSSETAPKPGTIGVEPNIVVWWCDLYGNSDHTLPLLEPNHFNNLQAEKVGEWFKLTPNVQIWDYKLGGFDVCHEAAAKDAKFFADHGSPMMFMETEYRDGKMNPFYALNCYAMWSSYANPGQDPDAILRRFCRSYGKGADDMYAAIRFVQDIERAERSPTHVEWFGRRHPWRSRRNYEKLAAMCRAAYEKEPDDRVRSRIVDVLVATWKELVLIYKADPSLAKEYAAAQEAYRRYGHEFAKFGCLKDPSKREQLAKEVDDEVDVLTLKFKDLPDELKGVPSDELICADYHFFNAWDRNKLDPLAFRGHAVATKPKDEAVKGFPFNCGVYDKLSKEGSTHKVTADMLPADGKYHWVKLGKCHIGRDTILYTGSWWTWETLRDHYIVADGQKVDPNWYELWVSLRVDGPGFAAGSTADNRIWFDRYILRRVKP